MSRDTASDIVILVIAIVGFLYVAHIAACESNPSVCEKTGGLSWPVRTQAQPELQEQAPPQSSDTAPRAKGARMGQSRTVDSHNSDAGEGPATYWQVPGAIGSTK